MVGAEDEFLMQKYPEATVIGPSRIFSVQGTACNRHIHFHNYHRALKKARLYSPSHRRAGSLVM